MKQNKKLLLFCLYIFYAIAAYSQQKISLKDAIRTGIENNLNVNQAGLLKQKQELNYRYAKAQRFPNLNGFAEQGTNQGRSIDPFTNSYVNQNVKYGNYGLNSTLLIFNGFSLNNSIKENQYLLDATQMEWQQAKDDLTIQIIMAYLRVLTAADMLDQAKQRIFVSNEQVKRLDILNKEGAVAPSEFFNLKGEVANDELSVSDNKAALERARLDLCGLLAISYNKNLEVEPLPAVAFDMEYSADPEEVFKSARKNLAQIKAVHFRTLGARHHVRSVRGELFPVLKLQGSLNSNYSSAASRSFLEETREVTSNDYVTIDGNRLPVVKEVNQFKNEKISFHDQLGNNLFTSVGLNLTVPLFNGFRTKSRIEAAAIDQKNAELVEKNSSLALQHDIESAYVEMVNAGDRYRILQGQVIAFGESFRAAEIRFNAGDLTSVDYLIAKNNLDKAKINLIVAGYDFVLRKKILEYYRSGSYQM